MSKEETRRWPVVQAEAVGRSLIEELCGACKRITIAGSIRRQKPMVGDVEILYIPRFEVHPMIEDFWGSQRINLVDIELDRMLARGTLGKRLNTIGREVWGDLNKLAVHMETGIPVDFFATTEAAWWNYLVCRTGPGESNIRIATAARMRGLKWHPYGQGFERMIGRGGNVVVHSEQDVFEAVGMAYLLPEKRK